jgi:hypothetical protein
MKSGIFLQILVPPNSALSLSVTQLYNLTGSSLAQGDNSTNSTLEDDVIIETENVTFYVFIR